MRISRNSLDYASTRKIFKKITKFSKVGNKASKVDLRLAVSCHLFSILQPLGKIGLDLTTNFPIHVFFKQDGFSLLIGGTLKKQSH